MVPVVHVLCAKVKVYDTHIKIKWTKMFTNLFVTLNWSWIKMHAFAMLATNKQLEMLAIIVTTHDGDSKPQNQKHIVELKNVHKMSIGTPKLHHQPKLKLSCKKNYQLFW